MRRVSTDATAAEIVGNAKDLIGVLNISGSTPVTWQQVRQSRHSASDLTGFPSASKRTISATPSAQISIVYAVLPLPAPAIANGPYDTRHTINSSLGKRDTAFFMLAFFQESSQRVFDIEQRLFIQARCGHIRMNLLEAAEFFRPDCSRFPNSRGTNQATESVSRLRGKTHHTACLSC